MTISIIMPDGKPWSPSTRYFVPTGGNDMTELIDRAAAHGEPMASAGYASPAGGAYGLVEVDRAYQEFVAQKRIMAGAHGIEHDIELNSSLFPFQADIVRWALRRGRAAIWADCGLGKSWMALEWARVVARERAGTVLILTPLAVAQQFVREGAKLDINVTHCREQKHVNPGGINVANYEVLHKFDTSSLVGIVADESSILKDYTSSTRNALIEAFARTPFRLACTATPSPNDIMELGNHAEFLGVMNRVEMLAMFFTHDGGDTSKWRLKGHAQKPFWKWVCSWAVNVRRPSDLGYPDDGFDLPALEMHERVVRLGMEYAQAHGSLFVMEAQGLAEQREARKASVADRVDVCAEIVNAQKDEPWIVWCDLNDESERLAKAIPGSVEIRGSNTAVQKELAVDAFATGKVRVIVSKPSICGWGLNWQHCARVAFVGLSHSFEAWYQAIRRTYRFGQKRAVECYMISSDAEGSVVANLKRKQVAAEDMARSMVAEMSEFTRNDIGATKRDQTEYNPKVPMTIPEWIGKDEP
jgi:superfamily II DNA or RNA helicase